MTTLVNCHEVAFVPVSVIPIDVMQVNPFIR